MKIVIKQNKNVDRSKPMSDRELADILRFIRALRDGIDGLLDKGYTINADGSMKPPPIDTKH